MALCGGTHLNRLALERRQSEGKAVEGFKVDSGKMKRLEALNAHIAIASAISVQRKPSAPHTWTGPHHHCVWLLRKPFASLPHCIQRAATRTAAIWIPSSCPVREREKHLVVAKEKKKRNRKVQKSFFLALYDAQIWEWGLWKLFV